MINPHRVAPATIPEPAPRRFRTTPREWNNGLIVEAECLRVASPHSPPVHTRQLRTGLWMHWGAERLPASDLQPDGAEAVLFAFLLEGSWHEAGTPLAAGQLREAGRMVLMRSSALQACRVQCMPAFHVTLAASPAALDDLFTGDNSLGSERVRQLVQSTRIAEVSLPLSNAARFSAESIHRCPFAGACRGLALAARGLDMLAEFIAALNAEVAAAAKPPHLPLQDTVAHVRIAAELLERQLEHPPSIVELARSVGLSESTLKRGFHQLFGTTPFGHLRARRMEHARQLLERGEKTVLEAAAFVGYSNPSNFATAFRKQFGMNPKTFQMAARR